MFAGNVVKKDNSFPTPGDPAWRGFKAQAEDVAGSLMYTYREILSQPVRAQDVQAALADFLQSEDVPERYKACATVELDDYRGVLRIKWTEPDSRCPTCGGRSA